MFDFLPARALKHELLAMTPGTNQFAQRLRALRADLDADQGRLDRAIDETSTARPMPKARLS
ncbi:MAG: hypothetical protein QOH76_366 [Thermoleophilaceae bacterium]|jgi:hypothetical protein|nr:hypothetical protein [Thermoleophilaceae bacterium]